MSTLMGPTERAWLRITASLALGILLAFPRVQGTPQKLQRADMLRVIGCLTQRDAPLAIIPSYSGPNSLHIRYIYLRDEVDERDTDIFLIIYGANGREAAYHEISLDAAGTGGALVFRTAGSLKRHGPNWVLDDALGGIATRNWTQRMVDRVSKTPLRIIPLSEISTPERSCWWKPSPQGRN